MPPRKIKVVRRKVVVVIDATIRLSAIKANRIDEIKRGIADGVEEGQEMNIIKYARDLTTFHKILGVYLSPSEYLSANVLEVLAASAPRKKARS